MKVVQLGTVPRRTGRRKYVRVGSTAASLLPTPVQQATVPARFFTFRVNYGASTTQMGKLLPRLAVGRNGGCPVLVFGITTKLIEKL
ncbi:hypothetical protein NP590_18500 [Methylomonas sp. SURF-2]|uniref:Uncharacterized protein n=2 Tax=Methylomonas subterranea TaxID=2952225 RepID=A0ABT1TKW4_9GAMM|nr:BglII/BstYI family type II restriction endonuclease [Methylomonas sp. SURF-2]MCQ8106105.1 hypothetical protein [Methylomonas sp. SURF-2]